MAQPTLSELHYSSRLTDFSSAFFQEGGYSWSQFAPLRPVQKQTDRYVVWDRGDFFRTDAQKRAPGTESAGRDFGLSDSTYYCDVYAVHHDISEQELAQADPAIDLEEVTARVLAMDLNLRAEIDAQAAFLNTASVWTTDSTPGTLWDDAASTPIENIATGIKTVASRIGRRPNTFWIGADVWYDGLMNHPDIIARLPDNAPRIGTEGFLGNLLGIDRVLVAQTVRNTAQEGLTASYSFVSGKHAVLAYVDPNPGLNSPTAAVSFSWTGLTGAAPNGIRTKRLAIAHKDALPRIESDHALDFKVVAADAGYRFGSVVS